MTTERLYEFLILSKTLNYSTAAQNLYISQSVLSKHMKSMEEELNVRLLERTTHGVSLTAAGLLLAQKASGLLEQCEQAVNTIHLQSLPLQGTIRIACCLELSYASHIQVFISRFMERYPDISVTLFVSANGTPEDFLEEYDLVFTPCEYQNTAPYIQAQLLRIHGTFAVLPPGHPLLSRPSLLLRELESETMIVPFMEELFGPYAKNWQLAKRYAHNHIHCICTPNLSTALFLVSIGQGIAIVPRYARHMLANNMIMIGISNPDCQFREYLYYCSKHENSAAKLFFQEFCSTFHLPYESLTPDSPFLPKP